MLLINGTLCSKDFRKIGAVHSCINIFFQLLCLGVLTMVIKFQVIHDRGGHATSTYMPHMTKIALVALAFVILEIIIYSSLAYGLIQRKPFLLLVWLCFAPTEFIIVQVALLWSVYAIINLTTLLIGILALVVYMLVTLYLVHNACVVLSARHGFIKDQKARCSTLSPLNSPSSAIMANASMTPYLQYPQHNLPIQQMPGWGYGYNPQYPQPVVNQFHYNSGVADQRE